jgi:hypothetical protein
MSPMATVNMTITTRNSRQSIKTIMNRLPAIINTARSISDNPALVNMRTISTSLDKRVIS